MAYTRQPHGYCDNQELARALRANRHARDLVRRILDEQPARGLLYQFLAELAHALGDELDALTAMNQIRLEHRGAQRTGAEGASDTQGKEPSCTSDTLQI